MCFTVSVVESNAGLSGPTGSAPNYAQTLLEEKNPHRHQVWLKQKHDRPSLD